MDSASKELSGPGAGRPSLDESMRWVREELDASAAAPHGAVGPPARIRAGLDSGDERRFATVTAGRRRPRVALLSVSAPGGAFGGSERLVEGLGVALARSGVVPERIELASDESSFDRILQSYLRAYDSDLSAFDGVISTKAPSYVVRHRNHASYLMHTLRSFYDMFEEAFPDPSPSLQAQRDLLRQIDTAALGRASLRGVFAVGAEAGERLRAFNGIDAEVLHHPSTLAGLRPGAFRHLLLPGRLHPWKRVDLAIAAVRRMRNPVELVVTGVGEDEARLQTAACGSARIRFVGHVDDAALAELYADSLGVLYCPVREDYGLVTVEAFASGKPVVTCRDSGEPARLVADGVEGFVCAPDADAMAERLDWLAENAEQAAAMGRRGREVADGIGWEHVCDRLLAALGLRAKAA